MKGNLMIIKRVSLALGLIVGMASGAFAQDIESIKLKAAQGDAKAQYNLGIIYDKGYGVPEDDAEAVKWYKKAAEQGDAEAQYSLGFMYYYGDGVPKNLIRSYLWVLVSAEQGNRMAKDQVLLLEEEMTDADMVEGYILFMDCDGSDYVGCE